MTTHKTIEQYAEEYANDTFRQIEKLENNTGVSMRTDEPMCICLNDAYLAGAEKQKKLSDEREAIMLDIIGKLMGAQAIATGAIMVLQPGGIVNKVLDETIASVEKKLKELKEK